MSYLSLPAVVVILVAVTWYLAKRVRRQSIAQLPGPPSQSWLVGNVPEYERPEIAAEADFAWTKEYGLALRTKGCFGEDVLYLADPKALQYILNKRLAVTVAKIQALATHEIRTRLQLATGRGIVWAEGAQHARQRKIMNPAFSHSALKGFLPLFLDIGQRTSNNCKAGIIKQNKESAVVDVSDWMVRTMLDIIGQAAFGYKFDTIDNKETELSKSYHNLFSDVNYMPSDFTIAFRRMIGYAPKWLAELIFLSIPQKNLQRQTHHMEVSNRVARELVDAEMKARMDEKEGGKDIMSIFIKANASEDPKRRLDEDEILSQVTTLMLAGHETTANTVSWALYELSKKPEAQRKLRDEVRAARAQATARGDQNVTISDLDTMKYMGAVMKETLRYHTVVLQLFRRAAHDDVIPLDIPQRTVSGDLITAIPISEGQVVQISFAAYNRIKSVWGEDAEEWRPERFLDGGLPEQTTTLGVLGNLATFSSGIRSCSGWRFALIEMQALLVELIDNFEFSPAPGNLGIKRVAAGILQSMVKGQEGQGTQLPLTVAIAKKSA